MIFSPLESLFAELKKQMLDVPMNNQIQILDDMAGRLKGKFVVMPKKEAEALQKLLLAMDEYTETVGTLFE